jgi:hypothetical protein
MAASQRSKASRRCASGQATAVELFMGERRRGCALVG